MERVISQDERIRRAQEIYERRQSLRERTKRATVNVSEPKNFKLFKRLALQIIICMLIYFIFYLVNTTNYSFSESALEKTEELISHDVDFINIYNSSITAINEYISSLNIVVTNEITEENEVEEVLENQEVDNTEEQAEDKANNNEVSVNDMEEIIEQTDVKDVELSETDRIKQNYSFILPVSGYVTSEFGERESTSSIVSTYHKGIDIGAITGTTIIAATDGKVISSQFGSSYGNYIIIENGEVKTVYAHCSELLVSARRYSNPRTRNCKGSVQLGNATGPHLHFEIRINNVCINPRQILNF